MRWRVGAFRLLELFGIHDRPAPLSIFLAFLLISLALFSKSLTLLLLSLAHICFPGSVGFEGYSALTRVHYNLAPQTAARRPHACAHRRSPITWDVNAPSFLYHH
jgi:hypothetical protein